ncbi:MAG: transposase [Saprospiraceae bacterium]|nr:transposase [Saprospiraceae bacterium]
MKTRRKYDRQFKLEVVNRSLECNNIDKLGEELSIHPDMISRWRREFLKSGEKLSFPGNGKEALSQEEQELRRLRKELADSRLETQILRRLSTSFPWETQPLSNDSR